MQTRVVAGDTGWWSLRCDPQEAFTIIFRESAGIKGGGSEGWAHWPATNGWGLNKLGRLLVSSLDDLCSKV